MYKFFGSVILIAIFIGAFHYYTQSGEVLNEEAPVVTETNTTPEPPKIDPNKPLLQEDKMKQLIPDEPEAEPELPTESQEKIDEMVEKGLMTLMTDEEKRAMNEEAVAIMQSGEVSTSAKVSLLSDEAMKKLFVTRQGMFTEIDLIHKGSGLALIYPETAEGPILRLENFNVTRGPDLHVYLSRNENITSSDQLGDYYDLGVLKSSKGNQNYQLPSNHSGFKSVVIWCKAFGVLFSSATLQP